LEEFVLTYVDRGLLHCVAVAPFEDTAYGCVLCPGIGLDDERCLCDCHTGGVDIMTFIDAHLMVMRLMGSSWHDPEQDCVRHLRLEELRAQVQLSLAVPAVAEVGCACGSEKVIGDVADALWALAELYGPGDEVTRRIACTWSGSSAFNPAWAC